MSRDMTNTAKWLWAQRRLRSAWAVRMKKAWVLGYPLSVQRRLWSDRTYAQADLSLCWGHTHFVGFVMSWLIYVFTHLNQLWCHLKMMFIVTSISVYNSGYSTHLKLRPLLLANQITCTDKCLKVYLLMMLIWCGYVTWWWAFDWSISHQEVTPFWWSGPNLLKMFR